MSKFFSQSDVTPQGDGSIVINYNGTDVPIGANDFRKNDTGITIRSRKIMDRFRKIDASGSGQKKPVRHTHR